MATLRQADFSAGWIPSDDPVRGRRNGLLRMDNLQLDEHAAISLVKGGQGINNAAPFSDDVHSIFSRTLNGTKYTYVGLQDGKCLRDSGAGIFPTTIANNGSPGAAIKTAFAPAFDHVLICHGTEKVKDKGGSQSTLGVKKPTSAVTATGGSGATLELTDSYAFTAQEGSVTSSGTHHAIADVNATTFRFDGYRTYTSSLNTTVLGGSVAGREDDTFTLEFRIPDTAEFISLQVIFYFGTIDGTPDTTPDMTDHYEFTWDALTTTINEGKGKWSNLIARRDAFTRIGVDNTKNWTNVTGIRIVVVFASAVTSLGIGIISFTGGATGPLTGKYSYRQINVANDGYIAKSGYGPDMAFPLELTSGFATVTPHDPSGLGDAKINEVWIYRRKTDATGGDPLGRWLLVKVKTSSLGTAFTDNFTDDQALQLNDFLNEFLVSVQDVPLFDDVYYIIPNYFERTFYMTPRDIFISDNLDPDAIDTRFTIKISSNYAETNLWMIKSGPSTILVGTSQDIYEISGELQLLSDGTLNILVRPLGVKQPPIIDAVCMYKNTLFYIGTDGLNALTGAINTSFNGALDLLWNGTDRYGKLAFLKDVYLRTYYLAVSKGKLFVSATNRDTSKSCVVYDFRREYWYNYDIAQLGALFTEEDDTLLAGATIGTFKALIKANVNDGAFRNILLRTSVFDDNLPFNRKDNFIFKAKLDTGGVFVEIRLYLDEHSSYDILGQVFANGMTEVVLDMATINGGVFKIAKSIQLEIAGTALSIFRMTEWAIEYDARPTQTLALRIPPNNYGTAGRKRISTIPFIIDTLGSNVVFTPVIDGVDQAQLTLQTTDKQVVNHYFTSDKKGYTVGGRLVGTSPFEFYELVQPRTVELLPDSTRFLIIPPTNLGTQCRKRITAIAFVIDTNGNVVTFTPIIDGNALTPAPIATNGKQTVIHYFDFNVTGTDISGKLEGASFFEYYNWDLNECITEKMPIPTKYLVIPQDDYGTPARKRFSSFKFKINTRGGTVTFRPRMDGADLPTADYITVEPTVVEYFSSGSLIGTNLGGTLFSLNPFEFYGALKPEIIEKLPDRVRALTIAENNFGVAAKKRVRTLPLLINTNGFDVIFSPIVDGAGTPGSTFNTVSKQTVFHYFETDSFGVDYSGTLTGAQPFEFYGMLTPEEVQTIPVGKKLDQIGPIEFLKLGKVLAFRIRLIPEGTSLNYNLYADDTSIKVGTISTVVNKDQIVEVSLPKGTSGSIFRLELSASLPFHRFYGRFKVLKSGSETEASWILFGADPDAKVK